MYEQVYVKLNQINFRYTSTYYRFVVTSIDKTKKTDGRCAEEKSHLEFNDLAIKRGKGRST